MGDRKKTGMGSNGEAKLGNMGEPKIMDIFATKYNKKYNKSVSKPSREMEEKHSK